MVSSIRTHSIIGIVGTKGRKRGWGGGPAPRGGENKRGAEPAQCHGVRKGGDPGLGW